MLLQGLQLFVSLFGLAGIAQRAKQSAVAFCAVVAGAVLCLIGAGFVLSAVRGLLARHFGPIGADTIIGIVFALVGVVIILAASVRRKPRAPSSSVSVATVAPAALGALNGATTALNARLRKSIKSKPHGGIKAVAVVAGLGFILARLARRR